MTNLSLGKTCMKYILFVINFLFFVLGAVAFALGIWALVDKNKLTVLTKVGVEDSNFDVAGLLDTAALVLLVGGAAILLLGFVGCYGAMKQNQCLLCLYGLFLVVVLMMQIAAIVIAIVFKGQVEDEMQAYLKRHINITYEGKIDTKEEFSLGLDYAQVYFECCGVDSYKDFEGTTQWTKNGSVVPVTCCKLTNSEAYLTDQTATLADLNCPTQPSDINSYWNKPCWQSIKDYLLERVTFVIVIAAAILLLEVVCIVFTCCIIAALRKEDEY